MFEQLKKMLSRQTELVEKITSGKASDAEKKELETLTKALKAVSNPETVEIGKTRMTTMTVEEFQAHVEKEQESTDPVRLALLRQNIDAVKSQGKTKKTDVVAVNVKDPEPELDKFAALEKKFDALMEMVKDKFDGRTNVGVNSKPAPEPTEDEKKPDVPVLDPTAKAEAPMKDGETTDESDKLMTEFAVSALNKVIDKFNKIKEALKSGNKLDEETMRGMWPNWQMQDFINMAIGMVAKMDEAKTLADEVLPQLQDISKTEPKKPEGESEDEPEGDKKTEDDKADDKVAKSDSKTPSLLNGRDLSPAMSSKEAFTEMKKNSRRI